MDTDLKETLAHIFWLGGSPCAGKSSICEVLAERHNLRCYHCDVAFNEHRHRFTPAGQPTLFKWTHTPWDELWMQPAAVLLDEAIACYREHFDLILQDLRAFPKTIPILAEGNPLLPDRVFDLLRHPRQAIWLVPTAEFQKKCYPERGAWVQTILSQCTDPDQAFQNWMARDIAFANWITGKATALQLTLLPVDGQRTIAENAELVARHFGLTGED